MRRRLPSSPRRPAFLLALWITFAASAMARTDQPAGPSTTPAASPAASPAAGFIHGTATWPDGHQVTGFIRWKNEEAFWGDLFHTGYRENPWSPFVDLKKMRAQRRKEYFATHGLVDRLAYALEEDDKDPIGWRMLLIRVGDIRSIEIHDGEDDFLVTADGSRHQIGGYGNDAGADLLIYTGEDEPLEVEWNDLTGLEFSPAPADAVPYGRRAYGLVETSEGPFEGFVQWDVSECVSIDILDGRLDGKNRDFALGEVRSLARARGENATVVETRDGQTITLGGSNDLNSGNRGLYVENPGFGKVLIPWKRFQKVTFSDAPDNGPGRESYAGGEKPLRGTVSLRDGRRLQGRLVYDLDEGWAWDLFNGQRRDMEYIIPFALITAIEPRDNQSCRVTLRNGQSLELEGEQDTGDGHGGVLVFTAESGDRRPEHVAWGDIRRIDLR